MRRIILNIAMDGTLHFDRIPRDTKVSVFNAEDRCPQERKSAILGRFDCEGRTYECPVHEFAGAGVRQSREIKMGFIKDTLVFLNGLGKDAYFEVFDFSKKAFIPFEYRITPTGHHYERVGEITT